MKPNQEHAQKERDIFASNFRRILKIRGKTQSDVVSDLEITSSTVSDWANAKKYPRVDKMQALADYLGVVISDLRETPAHDNLQPAEPKEKPTPVFESGLSKDETTLIELFRRVPQEQRAAMLQAIEMTLRSQGLL